MAKLALVFVAFTIGFAFLDFVMADEAPEHEERTGEVDEEDRSGAYAHASISLRPAYGSSGRPGVLPPRAQTGLVQCYACVDCPDVLPNTTTKWCPRTLDPSKHSSCVTYAEQYKHLRKSWYIRGCATERGSCSDIRQAHSSHTDIVKLVFCDECEGDRCNSASRSLTDFTLAIFALLVTPLVSKIALS